jgi:hypothetical protein
VISNDNSLNATQAFNGSSPLYGDAVVFTGLPAGQYYIAVSGATNVPDPANGMDVGTNGVYDPNITHSGMNGYSTGNYVLNVAVQEDNTPPMVLEVTTLVDGPLTNSPTTFTVRFSEPMNITQLANDPAAIVGAGQLRSVFIRGADGQDYHPRLVSYDSLTNTATFLMLDRVPVGAAELHLSGALGLADYANNPLKSNTSNDPTGDYVVSFSIDGPTSAPNGNQQLWLNESGHDSLAQGQDIGLLFPREIQNVVLFRRELDAAAADTADFYRIEVLQTRTYFFGLVNAAGLPTGTVPQLFTPSGQVIFTLGRTVRQVNLTAGVYYIRVGGWAEAQAPNVKYDLRITLGTSQENPTPLTAGPAPAYRLNFRATSSGGGDSTPITVTPTPGTGNNGGTIGGTQGPRLSFTDPFQGLNVVPAFLATAAQPLYLSNGLGEGIGSLSEGPVGGVRSDGLNSGGKKPSQLTLPVSGHIDDDEIKEAVLEEEVEEGKVTLKSVSDNLFATFSQALEQFRRSVGSSSREQRIVVDWLSQWLGSFNGLVILPDADEETHNTDEPPFEQEWDVFESPLDGDEESPSALLLAAGLVAMGLHRDRENDRKQVYSPSSGTTLTY